MSARHVGYLALLGWYLMTPPLGGFARNKPDGTADLSSLTVDVKAPISRWKIESSHDTASECELTAAAIRTRAGNKTDAISVSEGQARCIATDDPRLAK